MAWQNVFGHGLTHSGLGGIIKPFTTAVGYLTNAAAPMEMPNAHELIHLHQRGWITDEMLRQGCVAQGVPLSAPGAPPSFQSPIGNAVAQAAWSAYYWATSEYPTQVEMRDIANRQMYSDQDLTDALASQGYVFPKLRENLTNLRYEIPGPADMVRFSIRHVFEPDLVRQLGYDDEYRPILDFWHRMQGLEYPIFTGPFAPQIAKFEAEVGLAPGTFLSLYAAQGVPEPSWARAYWWSHWVVPSPTQGYLMWQRLNPLRDTSYDGPEMSGLHFDYQDLELLLRANDYPPKWRALLAGISRPIPGIRFAREFRRNNVYDFNALLNWALRQGYAPQDSIDIATDIERWAVAAQQKPMKAQGLAQVREAYDLGLLDLASLGQLATQWGLDPKDVAIFQGISQQDRDNRRARKVIAAMRKQFLTGKIDQAGVQRVLGQYGINGQAIADYLADWQIEMVSGIKEVSADRNIKWTCRGIITLAELDRRLANLGYSPADVLLMHADVAECVANQTAKALAAASRAADKQHRASVAQQKYACQLFQEARRKIASHGTPAQLRKWYCDGHVGAAEVYDRLRFLDWTDPDITRLLSDCKSGQPAPSVPPAPGSSGLTFPTPPAGTCPPGP
jgi:hypothetical protein